MNYYRVENKMIDELATARRTYYFLRSYPSLLKLANLEGYSGPYTKKAIEIINLIETYRENLNESKREIFDNLFIRKQNETKRLPQLFKDLAIDRVAYEHIKVEILLDFAQSYRGGVLLSWRY